jgi:hypothetical protein
MKVSQESKSKEKQEPVAKEQSEMEESKNVLQESENKDKGKELVAEDRVLKVLMDMCRRQDYSCSAKYAKKFLLENDNKIVDSLKAIIKDITERKSSFLTFKSLS